MSRLIIHCSDTPNGRPYTARDIDRWHAARSDIAQRDEAALVFQPQYPYCGYHGVIEIGGALIRTRADGEHGSHTKGQNSNMGVCLIGVDAYTSSQWATLKAFVEQYGFTEIFGHYVFNTEKTCPGFDVEAWGKNGMMPLPQHLI